MNIKTNKRLWLIGGVLLAIVLLLFWLVTTIDLSAYYGE